MKFIDSLRFMSIFSSNLADDLSNKFHGKQCDCYCKCFPEYQKVENNLLLYNCINFMKIL